MKKHSAYLYATRKFITECCVVDALSDVLFGDVYKHYVRWCEENKSIPMSNKAIANTIDGFTLKNITLMKFNSTAHKNKVFVRGLSLNHQESNPRRL